MLKNILIGLMLLFVTSTAGAKEDDESADSILCELFGITCQNDDEDDGEWGEDPKPKQAKATAGTPGSV